MALTPGEPSPEITAENQWGEPVVPAFTDPAVVYFYPRDHTPGCTVQAKEFNALTERFDAAGVAVYGVSMDDVDEHCAFAQTHDLGFDLLADPDGAIADTFDVAVDKDGRAERTTFVIAREQVVGVYEGVRPEGHASSVLRDLAEVGLVPMSGRRG
jgi:peroxiredoxin Q/BCP